MVVHFIVYVLFIEEYIGIIFAPDVSSGMELSVDKRVRSRVRPIYLICFICFQRSRAEKARDEKRRRAAIRGYEMDKEERLTINTSTPKDIKVNVKFRRRA